MIKVKKNKIIKKIKGLAKSKHGFVIFIAIFTLISITILFVSRAATPSFSIEPENGQIQTPATSINDTTASDGRAIKFGDEVSSGCSSAIVGYTSVFVDCFNTFDSTKWSKFTGTQAHHQAKYELGNVTVASGRAELLTRRHCVTSTSTEALSDANTSVIPCAAGLTTKYSAGGINSIPNWRSGKMLIKAKLPTAQKGLWPALWIRNASSWCTTNYGEIDILEWYYNSQDTPTTNRTTATTHMTCANNVTKKVQHYEDAPSDLTTTDHVWEVDWDSTGVTYRLDGVVVRTSNRSSSPDGSITKDSAVDFGLTQAVFDTIMNQQWYLKINTQVIKPVAAGQTQWHAAADNTVNFNPVTFSIDSVEVFTKN